MTTTIKTTQNTFPYAQVFDLEIMLVKNSAEEPVFSPWQWLARILILENNQSPLKLGMAVENLPTGEYYFRFLPLPKIQGDVSINRKIRRLGIGIDVYSIDTGVVIKDAKNGGTRNVHIRGAWVDDDIDCPDLNTIDDQGVIIPNLNGVTGEDLLEIMDDYFDEEPFLPEYYWAQHLPCYVDPETESWSTDQRPAIAIESVSEVVDLFPPYDNYPGVSVATTRIQANERITQVPQVIQDIERGRIVKKITYVGVANTLNSNGTVISNGVYDDPVFERDGGAVQEFITAGMSILNPKTSSETTIRTVTATSLTLDSSIGLVEGDDIFIFKYGSSSYLPDIFLDLMTSDKGGLGQLFNSYDQVDLASLWRAKQFCFERRYYWDGVLDNQIPFAQWAVEQAISCKLLATRVNGQYGLIPEDETDEPVMIFNETNIIKGSYQETTRPDRETEVSRVVVSYLDGYSTLKPLKTLVIEYRPNGLDQPLPVYQERPLNFPSVTRPMQALEVGASILLSSKLQKRVITFKTSFQGLFLKAGDLILVQYRISEIEQESSGRCLEIIQRNMIGTIMRINKFIDGSFDQSEYTLSFHDLENNEVYRDLPCNNSQIPSNMISFDDTAHRINVGDPFVVSRESSSETEFRVTKVEIGEDYQCTINAIEWTDEIFSLDDIYSEPSIANIQDFEPNRLVSDQLKVKREEWFADTSSSLTRISDAQA